MKIIIIGGDNGGGSAGDEVMCEAACAFFRQHSKDLEILTDAQRTDWNAPIEGVKVFQQLRKDHTKNKNFLALSALRKIARLLALPFLVDKYGFAFLLGHGVQFRSELKGANILFFAGCGGLNDKYPINALAWWSMIKAAKKLGIKVYISGLGIGPLANPLVSLLVKKIVNSVDFISVRDTNFSYSYLKKNKTDANYSWVPDDAFHYLSFPKKKSDPSVLRVGINFMPTFFKNKTELSCIAKLLSENLESNFQIHLLPITHEDYEALHSLGRHISGATIHERTTPSKMKALVNSMDFLISARYHGCVFGVSQKIPTIGVYSEEYWRQKIAGVFEMAAIEATLLKLSDFVFALRSKTLSKLIYENQSKIISDTRLVELENRSFFVHKIALAELTRQGGNG
jgi:polysaccharide pyruvyl transferase WcaK-like protein